MRLTHQACVHTVTAVLFVRSYAPLTQLFLLPASNLSSLRNKRAWEYTRHASLEGHALLASRVMRILRYWGEGSTIPCNSLSLLYLDKMVVFKILNLCA